MSVIDNLRRKPTAQQVRAPDVLTKLQLAQSELDRLQSQHPDAALDDLINVEGASQRLADLEKEIATARAEVVTLQSAHKAALARDRAAIMAQRASLYRTQFAAVKRHLSTRDQAAKDLTEAFGKVAEAWNLMIAESKAAKAATPVGTAWPEHGLPDVIDFDGIKLLVSNELFRVAGDPKLGNTFSFPGSRPTPGNEGEPHKINPLADTMKAHTAFVIEKLTGKVPGA